MRDRSWEREDQVGVTLGQPATIPDELCKDTTRGGKENTVPCSPDCIQHSK